MRGPRRAPRGPRAAPRARRSAVRARTARRRSAAPRRRHRPPLARSGTGRSGSPCAPILNTGNPLNFFTNAASHLLASQLNVNLTQIQIYPTNQYTPSVHRLLQVAANIYDATTTNFYPSVFRPLFTRDLGGNVFVTGYTNVPSVSGANDIAFSTPFDISTISTLGGTNVLENVYGVPWIIGAKKGFPNFNKFAMQDVVQITRKLQIARSKYQRHQYQTSSTPIKCISSTSATRLA